MQFIALAFLALCFTSTLEAQPLDMSIRWERGEVGFHTVNAGQDVAIMGRIDTFNNTRTIDYGGQTWHVAQAYEYENRAPGQNLEFEVFRVRPRYTPGPAKLSYIVKGREVSAHFRAFDTSGSEYIVTGSLGFGSALNVRILRLGSGWYRVTSPSVHLQNVRMRDSGSVGFIEATGDLRGTHAQINAELSVIGTCLGFLWQEPPLR